MTDAKFTPDQWFAVDKSHGRGRKWCVMVPEESIFGPYIATIHNTADHAKANAHLIAAAPELYEAAIAMIAWDDSENSGPDYGTLTRDTHPDGEDIWRKWYDQNLANCARAFLLARSATSKARGES